MNTIYRAIAIGLVAALATTTAVAKGPSLGFAPGFSVYANDDKGGGWVIHHIIRGDSLWGCTDVANVQECKPVYFNEWRPSSKMSMLHVSKDSHNAWFKMSTPGVGDYLYACKSPMGTPVCEMVELELRPSVLVGLSRVWPGGECTTECDGGAGNPVGRFDPRYVIEDAARSDMWVQLGVALPGPINLYACRNLASSPTCQLSVGNWLAFDRQKLGFKKIEDIEKTDLEGESAWGPGVLVSKIDEESVAYEAGIREGDVITHVGGFQVDRANHAKGLLAQYPAETSFEVRMGDGSTKTLTAQRKPKKK